MKVIKYFAGALAASMVLTSCNNDDNKKTSQQPLGAYDKGVLILNQGGFGHSNSEISFLSNDFSTFQNDAFSTVNIGMTLGDTGQSIGFVNDLAFVVLNGSSTIEVVNRYTLKHVATIASGLANPRYIAFANGKGYVTNWGDGSVTTDDYVAVINLSNYTVESNIAVAEGPEQLVAVNSKLYVAHSGGWGYGNTVTVINPSTNTVSATIAVGDVPNSLVENNGILYVLCGGKPSWAGSETAGKLSKIKLSDNSVSHLNFTSGQHPSNLALYGEKLYYTKSADVFEMNVTASSLPSSAVFSATPQGVYGIYSFAVNNDRIFVGDAKDYSSNGAVYVYHLNGTFENEFETGIIPAGFYFN